MGFWRFLRDALLMDLFFSTRYKGKEKPRKTTNNYYTDVNDCECENHSHYNDQYFPHPSYDDEPEESHGYSSSHHYHSSRDYDYDEYDHDYYGERGGGYEGHYGGDFGGGWDDDF